MLAICNARKYGTGVPLNIDGNPMDGKFELVLVHNIDVKSLLKSALASIDEKYIDTESAEMIVTDYAEIEFDEPRLLQLDGEVIGKFKKIKIEILKGAVKFITHGDNIYIN
jgi:diacylglycerol kinase family enzyme